MKDTQLVMLTICLWSTGKVIWGSCCMQHTDLQLGKTSTLTCCSNHYFTVLKKTSNIYAIFWMSDLFNQALVYTATLNTAIRKSSATPVIPKLNRNVEKWHEEKTSYFSFFQNRFLKCSHFPPSSLESSFTIAVLFMHDIKFKNPVFPGPA